MDKKKKKVVTGDKLEDADDALKNAKKKMVTDD